MMISFERFLFYLLIFSLPFQTRTLIYQFGGTFQEYQSAFLYFTDILIGLIFISWSWRALSKQTLKTQKIFNNHSNFLLLIFFVIAGISLFQAANFWLGFYQWLKIAEFIWLFFYVKNNSADLKLSRISLIFIASAFLQAMFADWQWHNQTSLGLKLLGESMLDPNLAGVAKIEVASAKLIRGYGTFPHPNILASFLSAAIFMFYSYYLSNKKPYSQIQLSEWLKFLTLFVMLLGLFLTFSRAGIILFATVSLIFFFASYRLKNMDDVFKQRRQVLTYLFFIFTFVFIFLLKPEAFSRFGNTSLSEQSFTMRQTYNEAAAEIITAHPLLGVGIGNFTNRMSEFLPKNTLTESWMIQPVHNIYLLIAAETGVAGLFFFLWFLVSLIIRAINSSENQKIEKYALLSILFIFLIVGIFDHFFWTLQQGRLMLWIILALTAGLSAHSLTDKTQASEA